MSAACPSRRAFKKKTFMPCSSRLLPTPPCSPCALGRMLVVTSTLARRTQACAPTHSWHRWASELCSRTCRRQGGRAVFLRVLRWALLSCCRSPQVCRHWKAVLESKEALGVLWRELVVDFG